MTYTLFDRIISFSRSISLIFPTDYEIFLFHFRALSNLKDMIHRNQEPQHIYIYVYVSWTSSFLAL